MGASPQTPFARYARISMDIYKKLFHSKNPTAPVDHHQNTMIADIMKIT